MLNRTSSALKAPDLSEKEGKMGGLAVALAKEAFFGVEVMSKCTLKGMEANPVYQSKSYCSSRMNFVNTFQITGITMYIVAYEERWNKCLESISAACKRIRQKRSKQTVSIVYY